MPREHQHQSYAQGLIERTGGIPEVSVSAESNWNGINSVRRETVKTISTEQFDLGCK